MAVPKKKVSKARRNSRQAHKALEPVNVVANARPHRIDFNGMYKGKLYIKTRIRKKDKKVSSDS